MNRAVSGGRSVGRSLSSAAMAPTPADYRDRTKELRGRLSLLTESL
jgi:hypothetical protein